MIYSKTVNLYLTLKSINDYSLHYLFRLQNSLFNQSMQDIHDQPSKVPGEDLSFKTKTLCMGSAILEKFTPIKQICDHIVGFHCYSDNIKRQIIAHHYCTALNEDFRQCIIYDSDKADAKLIGVEYVISEKLFKTLPKEEKKYWHSHVFEVKAGLMTSPNIPYVAEHETMTQLISTYGKTIHLWQVDKGDLLPFGEPTLMMQPNQDNLVDWDLVDKRDKLLGVRTSEIRNNREDLIKPMIDPEADAWAKTGKAITFEVKEVNLDLTKFKN